MLVPRLLISSRFIWLIHTAAFSPLHRFGLCSSRKGHARLWEIAVFFVRLCAFPMLLPVGSGTFDVIDTNGVALRLETAASLIVVTSEKIL